jgi:hypothetical protein
MAGCLHLSNNGNLFDGLRCQQEFAIDKHIFSNSGRQRGVLVVIVTDDNQRQL